VLLVFYPIQFIIDKLVKVNLDAMNVNCKGSQAPAELLINIAIVGAVGLFVMSEYQLFWTLTMRTLNSSMVKKLMRTIRGSERREILMRLCFSVLVWVVSTVSDPFQIILRYLMGFVQLAHFFWGRTHASTDLCDNDADYMGVDSALAIGALSVFWFILLPSIYVVAHVMIPRCHGYVLQLLPDDLEDSANSSKRLQRISFASVSHSAKRRVVFVLSMLSPDTYIIRAMRAWIQLGIDFCTARDTERSRRSGCYAPLPPNNGNAGGDNLDIDGEEALHYKRLSMIHLGGVMDYRVGGDELQLHLPITSLSETSEGATLMPGPAEQDVASEKISTQFSELPSLVSLSGGADSTGGGSLKNATEDALGANLTVLSHGAFPTYFDLCSMEFYELC
jgi:hypothetical protein